MPLSSKLPISAAILAGGKSSRMKIPKCLIALENKRLIEILISNVKKIFDEIFIVTNFPELYFYNGMPLIGDIYPFKGPMAGIHAALKNSEYDVFAFACDMPCVKKETIQVLSEKHITGTSAATVASLNNKIYPLPGIYSKKLINELQRLLIEDKVSIKRFLDDINAQIIDVANLDKEGLSFININTEEDLKFFKNGGKTCLD